MDKIYVQKCNKRCVRVINKSLYANTTYSIFKQVLIFYKEHSELAEISPTFYHSIIDNCIQSLVVDICIMYENSENSENIYNLLNEIKKNHSLMDRKKAITANVFDNLDDYTSRVERFDNIDDFIDRKLKLIKENEDILKRLKALRDKYYAHFDISVKNIEKHFDNNKVSQKEIEDLLLLNFNICNGLLKYLSDSTYLPLPHNHDDFQRTLFYLTTKQGEEEI